MPTTTDSVLSLKSYPIYLISLHCFGRFLVKNIKCTHEIPKCNAIAQCPSVLAGTAFHHTLCCL